MSKITHAISFRRALTGEEAAHVANRILDNPEDPFPGQPDLLPDYNLTQPTIDSITLNSDDTLTLNYS